MYLLSCHQPCPGPHPRRRGHVYGFYIRYSNCALLLTVVLSLLFWNRSRVKAQDYLAHPHVVVFIPAYEGSKLYDPGLARPDGKDAPDGPCVWGTLDAIRKKELYYALRMPNQLVARPMLKAGPLDIYDTFVAAMTSPAPAAPGVSAAPHSGGKEAVPAVPATLSSTANDKTKSKPKEMPPASRDKTDKTKAIALSKKSDKLTVKEADKDKTRSKGKTAPDASAGTSASPESTTAASPVAGFTPYTLDKDFFIFSYDWRQDIATGTAQHLYIAMQDYAATYARATGVDPDSVRFILVTHSMGGLVARTMISQQPRFADRVERAYLVGPPNLGSVKALKTLLVGPGGLRESEMTFPSNLLKLLPNEISPAVSKLVAITRPSLYELLPIRDPRWIRIDDAGASTRVSADDLLTLGTWMPFWPGAEFEQRDYLTPYRKRFLTADEPTAPAAWEFCQDPMMPQLQDILAKVREWRLQLGTLAYSSQLMTRAGEKSRLRIIAGRGLRTPTGVTSEGFGEKTTARYTYEEGSDGDETVTTESVIEDLPPTSDQIVWLDKVSHGAQMNSPQFIDFLRRELAELSAVAPLPRPQSLGQRNSTPALHDAGMEASASARAKRL